MSRVRKSGGYRKLRTFQSATLIYDATYWFCEKYCGRYSRMINQMVQAARSGRRNIAEGFRAAATSSQTELRLVNVARAGLEELLLDYEDFLRHRRQPLWGKDIPRRRPFGAWRATISLIGRIRPINNEQCCTPNGSNMTTPYRYSDRHFHFAV